MANTINILSLCSGVGMLDEGLRAGLEHIGLDSRVLGYCERDAYAAACLLARMEDASLESAPIWCGDLSEMDARSMRGRIDAICAGFPCQPWSSAGKQEGTADERWLWPAILRIIMDVEPGIVFLENVPGLVSGGGLEHVLSGLASLGFDAEWGYLTAATVGAAHKRERVFILAYRSRKRSVRRGVHESARRLDITDLGGRGTKLAYAGWNGRSPRAHGLHGEAEEPQGRHAEDSESRSGPMVHAEHGAEGNGTTREESGAPSRSRRRMRRPADSGGVLANAEQSGTHFAEASRRNGARGTTAESGDELADTERGGLGKRGRADAVELSQCSDGSLFAPGPGDIDGWGRVVADGSFDFRAPAIKPGVRVLADGLALVVDQSRADQLRCGGNGVVALQAATAFVELMRRARAVGVK